MAHALDGLGIEHFLIVEKAASAGGTWRDNRYPGAACDVPSHLYSLSFAANPNWSRLFPRQKEILDHLQRTAAPWIARDRIRFGWSLRSLRWDADARLWHIESSGGERLQARHVVTAMGGLHVPGWPDIAGRDLFAGQQCHSARWPDDLAVAGKRVGVIGTGTSAIQLVPELARDAAALHVFQRTPVWILPRRDRAIPRWLQRVFAAMPPLRLALRGALYVMLESMSITLLRPRMAFAARAMARRHLRSQVLDPRLRAQLQAHYPIGCKRIALSDDYYPALSRPNVQLDTAAIEAIERDGVRMADGRRIALDVLVFATGFRPLDVLSGIEILGRDAESLASRWADRPRTANGIAVPGFPNLFFLLGPNTALGHNSVLYMIESQARHVAGLIGRARRAGKSCIEATEAAEARFIHDIDTAFPRTAWAGGCSSWYVDRQGRNIALWVGPSWAYRLRLRRALKRDYRID